MFEKQDQITVSSFQHRLSSVENTPAVANSIPGGREKCSVSRSNGAYH
jgi:hypothetical protein